MEDESNPPPVPKAYAHTLDHVRRAQETQEMPLNERQIWNLIARVHSPAWAEADAALRQIEQQMQIQCSPENRPIGSIGIALDSAATTTLEDRLMEAQAAFTILDETLRQDEDLQDLLQIALQEQQLIEESMGLTVDVATLTENLEDIVSRKNPASSIGDMFSALAKRVTKGKNAARPLPVPSSPKT